MRIKKIVIPDDGNDISQGELEQALQNDKLITDAKEEIINEASNPPTDVQIEELKSLAGDTIAFPFFIWSVSAKDESKELSEPEKKRLGEHLYRLLVKYHMERYMKEEIAFGLLLSFSIVKRIDLKKQKSNPEPKPEQKLAE